MHRGERRIWLVLMALAVLVLAGSGVEAQISSYRPDWWSGGWVGQTNLRAGWWNWDKAWIPDRGMTPDGWFLDFEVSPGSGIPGDPYYEHGYPWAWSHWAMIESNVHAGAGIELPWHSETNNFVTNNLDGLGVLPVIDLTLGNRPLHPWKLWYTEFHLAPGNDPESQEAFDDNLLALKEPGMPWWMAWQADSLGIEVTRAGWGEGAESNVWYAEFYFEPQPYWEQIGWTFDTSRFVPETSMYMSKVYSGTTCSPEPVTVALLALGLPAGLLIRRRRKGQ